MCVTVFLVLSVFFFKQKTAYEMRISDWSSDVCSSDLTSGISVHPQYRYAENQAPAITGYQASNTVNLKVRDIADLGKVLDALVASGANQVNGPGFEIDQPEVVYDEARREARKKAQARARMYAGWLGLDRKRTRLDSSH